METTHLSPHISRQYDAELEDIRNKVLAMGGLVEQQIADAVQALADADVELAEQVITNDYRVNSLEVGIDEETIQCLARRQPAAGDLRLLIAVIKTITDLERIGDQAEKVARIAIKLADEDQPRNGYSEIQNMSRLVREILHGALDAFARMDAEAAVQTAEQDRAVDQEYEAILRQRITYMMEDHRAISRSLNVIWAARALERIGDHACNLCEYVIYLVKGKDVRHTSIEQMHKVVEQ